MKKQNIPLVIGLLIPVAMVVFVACAIYIPKFFIKPHYSFAYAVGSYPEYDEGETVEATPVPTIKNGATAPIANVDSTKKCIRHSYKVVRGKITDTVSSSECYSYRYNTTPPQFFVYDVKTNTTKEVTFAELQKITLNDSAKSPDDFIVSNGYGGEDFSMFMFGGNRGEYSVYMKGKIVNKELNISLKDRYNFDFVGWLNQ